MSTVKLISQAEYAKHRGCTEAAVSKAIRTGRITLVDGRIDAAMADAQWAANTRARVEGGRIPARDAPSADEPESGAPDYWISRGRREAAEAEMAELDLGKMQGSLVLKADVDRAAFEAARSLRDGITNCSKRLGATVAVLTTPDECAAAIERELRALLVSWSKTMGVAPESAA